MKLPYDMPLFLRNGSNKEMLFNFIEQAFNEDKHRLQNRVIFFSNKDHCQKISCFEASIVPEKASDHEEADTKLVALVESSNIASNYSVMVRSPSGDTDILVLFLLHQFDGLRVLIDNGTGKNRKILDMSTSSLSTVYRQELAGMHAFSGNDYVSCFFRKGKKIFWKLIVKNPVFVDAFAELGLFNSVTPTVKTSLEKFICLLYMAINKKVA